MASASSRSSNTRPRPPQHESALAILADAAGVVADQNHRAVAPFHEKRVVASAMESLVADREHLIDQETFEVDRKRQCEHKTCPHARGKSLEGNVKLPAELGEIVYESEHVL